MEILYQDSSIVAIDKPSGLLTIPDGYHPEFENAKNSLDAIFGRVWTVHRLDKDTSGVVLFALNETAHRLLSIQFTERQVKKEYVAVTEGEILGEEFAIDLPLRVNGDRKHRTIVDTVMGKPASTRIIVERRRQYFTWIKAYPMTGFTHQIRCHLAAIDHPILCDFLYTRKDKVVNHFLSRLGLHAHQITFNNPANDSLQTITAEIPEQFLF